MFCYSSSFKEQNQVTYLNSKLFSNLTRDSNFQRYRSSTNDYATLFYIQAAAIGFRYKKDSQFCKDDMIATPTGRRDRRRRLAEGGKCAVREDAGRTWKHRALGSCRPRQVYNSLGPTRSLCIDHGCCRGSLLLLEPVPLTSLLLLLSLVPSLLLLLTARFGCGWGLSPCFLNPPGLIGPPLV